MEQLSTMLQQAGQTATLQEHQQALLVLLKEFDRVCRKLDIPYFLFAGTLLGAVRHGGFIPWDDDADIIMLREDYARFFREAPAVLDKEHFYLQQEFTDHWPMFFSKLRLHNTACMEKHHPKDQATHQGVYMDIFPCDNAYSTEFGRRLQFAASKIVIAKGLDRRGYDTKSKAKKLLMAVSRILPNRLFHRIVRGPQKRGVWVHSFLGGASKYSRNIYPAAYFAEWVEMPFESGNFFVPKDFDGLLQVLYQDYMTLPPEDQRKIKTHCVLVDLKKSYTEYTHYRDGMEFDIPIKSIR